MSVTGQLMVQRRNKGLEFLLHKDPCFRRLFAQLDFKERIY